MRPITVLEPINNVYFYKNVSDTELDHTLKIRIQETANVVGILPTRRLCPVHTLSNVRSTFW